MATPEGLIRTVLAPSCVVIDEWLSCPEMRAAATAFSSHPQMPPWAPGSGLLACLLAVVARRAGRAAAWAEPEN